MNFKRLPFLAGQSVGIVKYTCPINEFRNKKYYQNYPIEKPSVLPNLYALRQSENPADRKILQFEPGKRENSNKHVLTFSQAVCLECEFQHWF